MQEFLAAIVQWLSPLWENPSSFFNFDFLPKYWFYFRQGILYTLILSVTAVVLAVIPALLLALMRLSRSKFLRGLSGAYIAVFRSTPMTCSQAHTFLAPVSSCKMNLLPGTPPCGHFTGGSSPAWTYPQTGQT